MKCNLSLTRFVFLVLMVGFAGCASEPEDSGVGSAPETATTWSEPLAPAQTKLDDGDPLFARPRNGFALADSMFFIADPASAAVRAYALDGGFMTSEWRTRSISLFNAKGEFIRAVGEQLIMAMVPTPSGINPDKLFHEIDLSADSVGYGEAFGDVSEVLGLDGDFEKVAVSIDPGHLVPVSSERFIFVPKLFWGDVFLAEKKVDGWSLSVHSVGYPGADVEPFELVTEGPLERGYANIWSRGRGMIYRRESRGAWLSDSGELLIFLVSPKSWSEATFSTALQH